MKTVGFVTSAVNQELYEIFANPYHPTLDGVIAVGGRLQVDILQYAYAHGVFPWPHEGYPLLWFAPDERGVLFFDELHLPRSFKKWLKKNKAAYQIKMNHQFSEVIRQCRVQKRQGQKGSWITPQIEKAYTALHEAGGAMSLEIYENEVLVGGIYGVLSPRYFSCESMFHLRDNVSKLALYEMILFLQQKGFTWMDIQMVTEVSGQFGGKLISKKKFLQMIGY